MAAVDEKATYDEGLEAPADDFFAITPDDSNELPFVTRGIFVGSDGVIVAESLKGTQVTFNNCAAGSVLPIRVRKVLLTGTSASGLVGLI